MSLMACWASFGFCGVGGFFQRQMARLMLKSLRLYGSRVLLR